ncbi:N-formylglutamate amidohydrolase [Methylobacterium sp. A49B]|uniref:N-formylglutamate amidohydrolase n=1 Tax=Methylobacterium mesophilicum SR1.6/6 TaxID=908290 RepID=A0A6B9FH50_9HYPH|nr:N-formylglutamate amidohydrolase [Methylobacterium mesophilicum]QGY01727.1 N-formylglutamate amidohydrolase [Methylobacterium mesophilicum SR1.6/6]
MTRPETEAAALPEHPCEIIPGDPACGLVIACDHASNFVPPDIDLGVPAAEFGRHIAYDIGAAAVTRRLAASLNAPAILTNFSRLIIDPNRGRADPTLVMRLSDGAIVPGNARIDEAGKRARIARFYAPFDAAIDAAVAAAERAGRPPVILTMHSFTPYWRGIARPWQVGILYDRDERFARPLIRALEEDHAGLTVGDNQPYGGGLPGDTIDRHATARGLPNALVEIRQDLIAGETGQGEWADRFTRVLRPLLAA